VLAFETAIAVCQLTRMHGKGGAEHSGDHTLEAHRAARSGLLALVSAFGAFSLFVLALDSSASHMDTAPVQQASHQPLSQDGVSR
jgi:hypothetical protein